MKKRRESYVRYYKIVELVDVEVEVEGKTDGQKRCQK